MKISDLNLIHEGLDRMFFEHQRSLLHFEFAPALAKLEDYEKALLVHMHDEEQILLPVYADRCEFPPAAAPKLYLDDHEKMRGFVALFKETTAGLQDDPNVDNTLLNLLGREAFYLRLCSHHDRRESEFLYPILDSTLTEKERDSLLKQLMRLPETSSSASAK